MEDGMVNSHVVVGSGERRVIALGGWFGSARGWGSFPDYIDPTAFTYAFMDYRGYGGSKDATGEYTVEEIAADALAVADELGWQQFDLVGHSMGAKFIQRVMLDGPTRVR